MARNPPENLDTAPLSRRSLLAGAAVAALAPAPARRPLKDPDWRDVPGYIRYLETSKNPAAKQVLKQIDAGPKALARERKLCRAAGIPLTPADIEPKPVPPEQDAYPIYRRLHALLEEKPLDQKALDLVLSVTHRSSHSADEMAAIRQFWTSQGELMQLVDAAMARPFCRFPRDWDRVDGPLYPEFPTLRNAARLLKARSGLMAREGRGLEAVSSLSGGFVLAAHVAEEPLLIFFLVAQALGATALAGMVEILYASAGKVEVAQEVAMAVGGYRLPPLKHVVRGEIVFLGRTGSPLRNGSPDDVALALDLDEQIKDLEGRRRPVRVKEFTARERAFLDKLLDAAEADQLRRLRGVIKALELPARERDLILNGFDSEDNPTGNPVLGLSRVMLSSYANAVQILQQSVARAEVVTAGASVLVYRGRHDRRPERLEEALALVPRPPMTPPLDEPLRYRREGEAGFVVYSPIEFMSDPPKKFDGGRRDMPPRSGHVLFRWPASPETVRPARWTPVAPPETDGPPPPAPR